MEMIKKRSLAKYILLSLVTLGIYSIFFWYSFTEDVNKMCAGDGQESPNYILVMLLSFVTCGIYGLYWFYKQANRLRDISGRYGVTVTQGGTDFLLWFLVGSLVCGIGSLVGINVLISSANTVADGYNRNQGRPIPPTGYGTGNAQSAGSAQNTESAPGTGGYTAQTAQTQTPPTAQARECFCGECGTKMYTTDKFCPKCGAQNREAENAAGYAGNQNRNSGMPNVNMSAVKNMPLQKIAAICAFAIAGVILLLWLIYFHSFSVMVFFEDFIPLICMAAFGGMLYAGNTVYRKYETIPLMAFFAVLAINSTRIPLAITYQMELSWMWEMNSFWSNLLNVIIIIGALAVAVMLGMEFVGMRCDQYLLIVGAVLAVCKVFGFFSGILSFFRSFGYGGFPYFGGIFYGALGVLEILVLLLYVYQRNPGVLDSFQSKNR